MSGKFDFKKEYRDLYLPKNKPVLIDVPAMNFIMVDGKGKPSGKDYQDSIAVLYALAFTIKMSKMSSRQPVGYFEYVVPPLEGLWWLADGEAFDFNKRDRWRWTSMIRQPGFVTPEVFSWACGECRRKKPELDPPKARLESFTEGLCVQMMHVGPYAAEPASLALMRAYMEENNLVDKTGGEWKHHEIYLSDPRKTAPEKLKTVLRHPVAHRNI